MQEVIRDYYRANRSRSVPTLAQQYHRRPHPAIDHWPVVGRSPRAQRDAIAWEHVGSSTAGVVSIDRYVLRHSGRLVMPLLHVHQRESTRSRVLLDIGLNGKAGERDWPRLLARLEEGYDIVSFDLRGTGETRMRYRVVGDDPAIVPSEDARAYVDPLSSVTANYVYNALLTGRPHFLELVEDVEIAARFSRVKLGATRTAVSGSGDAALLASAASEVLPGVELLPTPGETPFRWSAAVESLQETWPVQYLMPGGAYLR